MRRTLYIIILLSTSELFLGQTNLVPNGSFETYTNCPNSTALLANTGNWHFAGASTDYYNACSPQGNMSVPSNIYGYQNAAQGNAYIGMICQCVPQGTPIMQYREPAQTALTQSLTINQRYFISFKVALTINDFESGGACNKLGALFSTKVFTQINGGNPAPVNNFAHVYSNTIITDTVNWTTIKGSFIADSAYSFITIGNFFDSTMSTYQHIHPLDTFYLRSAYYFVDDVRVSTDSLYGLSMVGINERQAEHSELSIFPNPADENIGITLPSNETVKSIELQNIHGQTVYRQTSLISNQIPTADISNGIYSVFIQTDNKKYRIKLIVRH